MGLFITQRIESLNRLFYFEDKSTNAVKWNNAFSEIKQWKFFGDFVFKCRHFPHKFYIPESITFINHQILTTLRMSLLGMEAFDIRMSRVILSDECLWNFAKKPSVHYICGMVFTCVDKRNKEYSILMIRSDEADWMEGDIEAVRDEWRYFKRGRISRQIVSKYAWTRQNMEILPTLPFDLVLVQEKANSDRIVSQFR